MNFAKTKSVEVYEVLLYSPLSMYWLRFTGGSKLSRNTNIKPIILFLLLHECQLRLLRLEKTGKEKRRIASIDSAIPWMLIHCTNGLDPTVRRPPAEFFGRLWGFHAKMCDNCDKSQHVPGVWMQTSLMALIKHRLLNNALRMHATVQPSLSPEPYMTVHFYTI